MTLWENVWAQVRSEMPQAPSRPRSWPGFVGALLVALVIIAIWFPIRLIGELVKLIDLTPKPDHSAEAQRLFREAHSLSLELPSRSDFAKSVLRHVDLPPPLRKFGFPLQNISSQSHFADEQ